MGAYPTTYASDANDNLASVEDPDGATTKLYHDWVGNRIQISREGREWHYTYDPDGNVSSQLVPYSGSGPTAYLTTYAYDALDRPTTNQVTDSWYGDYVNGGDSTHTTRTYDRRGLADATTWYYSGLPKVIADDTRNRAGLVTSRTHAPGSTVQTAEWSYDRLGRVVSEGVWQGTNVKAQQSLSYYDSDDVKTLAAVSLEVNAGPQTRSYGYSYDHQHQLIEATGPQGFGQSMRYLDSGRIDSATVSAPDVGYLATQNVTGRDVVYEYGAGGNGHEVTGLVDARGAGQMATYTYDEAGNMTSSVTHFGVVTKTRNYAYDAAGQLRIATVGGQEEVYYYLGQGKRLAAVKPYVEARMYAGALELKFNASNNTVTNRWVHIDHGTTTTRIENKSTFETMIQSTLGHTLAAIDTGGWSAGSFVYAPFGEQTFQRGAATHPRRINGKEEDSLTGLTYYGYRYYDPVAMIWTQGDPLYRYAPDISLEEPRKQNLYTYSLNNPLRYVDPDGRQAIQVADLVVENLPLAGALAATVYVATKMGAEALADDLVDLGKSGIEGVRDLVKGSPSPLGPLEITIEGTTDAPYQTTPHEDAPTAGTGESTAPDKGSGQKVERTKGKDDATSQEKEPTAGHRKNKRKGNEEKHQRGNKRRGRDKGGEKADSSRGPKRQRPPNHKGPWPPPATPPPPTTRTPQ